MDYGLPRADQALSFEMEENPVPTKTNPLGVKGAGEAGNVGALAAIMNAIVDALSPIRTRMGLFLSSRCFWFVVGFFVRSGKAVLRPVACDQVRGARGRGQGTETVAKLGGLAA